MLRGIHNKFLYSFSITSCIQTLTVYMYVLFMTHNAIEAEYASYISITYIVDFTVATSLFGFNLLILREKEEYVKNNIITISLISCTITSIVYFTWLFTIGKHTSIEALLCFTLIVVQYLYQIGYSIQIKFKQNKIALYNALINFTCAVIMLYYLTRQDALTCQNVLYARVIQLSIFSIICYCSAKKHIVPLKFISWDSLKNNLRAALPIGGGAILGTAIIYIDKFIISTLPDNDIAIYSIARLEIPFIGIFITNLSLAYMPMIRNALNVNNIIVVQDYVKKLFTYGWYLNVIFFTLLFCNAELIITTLYSDIYIESVPLFRILICAYLLKIFPYTNVIVSLGIEKIIIPRLFIEMILQIIVSLSLVHLWGLTGLAWSIIIVLASWSIPYNVYYIKKSLNTNLRTIIPFNKMAWFFLKCFIPTLMITMYVNEISQPIYGAIASICIILAINYKEIIYLYKNTK